MRIDVYNCVSELTSRNVRLRDISPIYPGVHEEFDDGELTLSTWVPFEYEGKHYQRHCIETGILGRTCLPRHIYARIHGVADQIQKFAKPITIENTPHLIFLDKVENKQLPDAKTT